MIHNRKTVLFFAEGFDDMGYEVIRKLSYSDGELKYDVIGNGGFVASATYKVINTPSEYVWYNILMSPLIEDNDGGYIVGLNVFENKAVDCLYPSEDLYPMAETAWAEAGSKGFYPIFGKWDNLKEA